MPQQKRSIQAPLSKSAGKRWFGPSRLTPADGILLWILIVVACGAALGLAYVVRTQLSGAPLLSSSNQHRAQQQQSGGGGDTNGLVPTDVEEAKSAEAEALGRSSESVDAAVADNLIETQKQVLVLRTKIGNIRIALRPDLSKESVDYIRRVMAESDLSGGQCPGCRLYRAEKPDILQGILRKDVDANTIKGSCPKGFEDVHNDCPEWDKNCGCHGPIMTKGMVGWAAGSAGGPDFFIDNHPGAAEWWGTQHTVWGEIQDAESFAVIDHVWTLPTKEQDGLTFLVEPLHFTVAMA